MWVLKTVPESIAGSSYVGLGCLSTHDVETHIFLPLLIYAGTKGVCHHILPLAFSFFDFCFLRFVIFIYVYLCDGICVGIHGGQNRQGHWIS